MDFLQANLLITPIEMGGEDTSFISEANIFTNAITNLSCMIGPMMMFCETCPIQVSNFLDPELTFPCSCCVIFFSKFKPFLIIKKL
jgi:hypothetical protein